MADTDYNPKIFVKDAYGNLYKKVRKAKKESQNVKMQSPLLQKTKQV